MLWSDLLALQDVAPEEIFSSSFAAAAYLEQTKFKDTGKKVLVQSSSRGTMPGGRLEASHFTASRLPHSLDSPPPRHGQESDHRGPTTIKQKRRGQHRVLVAHERLHQKTYEISPGGPSHLTWRDFWCRIYPVILLTQKWAGVCRGRRGDRRGAGSHRRSTFRGTQGTHGIHDILGAARDRIHTWKC